ncbi:MAG TPA: hypothetical protein ENN63_09735 [Bacteroidetes bacterium]|nr:hypothetical protein [Bacteroidota bacterium]
MQYSPAQLIKRFLMIWPVILFSFQGVAGQNFQFRNYDRAEGICNSFIYSIIQDQNGYLIAGTGNGLCRFNGIEFTQVSLNDSTLQGYVTTLYKTPGGTVWAGFSDGNALFIDRAGSHLVNSRQFTGGNINQITSTPDGDIYLATQANGLIHYRDSLQHLKIDRLIFSIGWMDQEKMLIGTDRGLYVYRKQGDSLMVMERRVGEIPEERVNWIIPRKEARGFWVAAAGGIYSVVPGMEPEVVSVTQGLGLDHLNIQHVYEDRDQNLWVSTFGQGAVKLVFDSRQGIYTGYVAYDPSNGLPTGNVRQVYQDHEGNIWMGTFGRGLSMLLDEAFGFYEFSESELGNNILSVFADEDGYWLGSESGIYATSAPDKDGVFTPTPGAGLPDDEITAIYKDEKGSLWVGTSGNGVYLKRKGERLFRNVHRTQDNNENSVRDISGGGDYVWIATMYGVFRIRISTGEKMHFTNRNGLSHNSINAVYVDEDHHAWIATTSRMIYRISPEGELKEVHDAHFLIRANVFTDLILDANGEVWAATDGNGVFHFTSDTVFMYTRNNGLLSEYCKSILADSNGHIWVGHRSGISRIDVERNVVVTYSANMGITSDCNAGAITLDTPGRVLIGTTQGLISYDYRKESSLVSPPIPNIVSLRVGDDPVPLRETIRLPYGIYRIRIEFIGLSYKDPQGVIYRFMMENYDPEWSEPSSNRFVNYPRITDGRYRFLLHACSSSGICTETPCSFEIIVQKPVWKTWWFYLIIVSVIVVVFVLIIRIREKNQRRLREYLEKELEIRTREVVEQKEELEIKNREITDSINYAQRIQASILPPESKLKEQFPGSFIFYLPRDIVSGDFYWFDRVNNDRFLIVCADSTGHGVPGAFMSMIGSTLIKEFTLRDDLTTPSLLLEKLDNEITQTLNQNVEMQRTTDGMDITICEINLKTRHLRFASAMRPIMLFHRNELMYIRGNRSSIGGELFDTKQFQDQEYALESGDILYMFSDGYPDQFGGPLGKKFKMVRLKNLLDDIHRLPMEEQYEHIKTSFFLWKKEYPQVDDVLFMGISIP